MLTSRRHLPVAGGVLIAVAIGALASVAIAQDSDRQKQVLVLYATRRDAQIAVVGDRVLEPLLGKGLPAGVDYYSEGLDQGRFANADYQTAFRDSLRLKYEQQRFDLVIPVGDIPVDFVEKSRDELFPDAAIVFFATRPPDRRLPNSTGLIVRLNFTGTIDLAATLQPNLQNIFVITSAGPSYEEAARAQFRSFGSRFAITYLSGLPTKALEAKLASLPENSIAYYLNVDRDGADQLFRPLDYLDRIAAVSNAPVYSWVDSTLGHGVVGGSLKVQEVQMQTTGAIALRVLRGEPADSIPVSSPDLNVNQVDWRELRRWRISEALVPSGTIVRFRELSVWDRYKIYILVMGAAFVAQMFLIAGLLAQRRGRRQAEREAGRSQAALRRSYDRLRDLSARLLKAQETERSRIARELHDDISQQMALLEMDLEVLAEAVDGQSVDLAGEVLHRANCIAKSVHDLSHRLHPEKLRLIGLPAALDGLQRELSLPGVVISVAHDNVPALPPDLTLCLFRVVQEALQNALKYSHAGCVSVSLTGVGEVLALTIVDDGAGFDVDAEWGKGLGLISMAERVDAVGGTFRVQSSPGAGTRLEISVPLSRALERQVAAS
jgi:signal transduction histidine kinase